MAIKDIEALGVRSSIEEWGIFRDAGEWDALEALFHPEGEIRVAWYQGHYKPFVAASRAGFGKSFAKHVICNSAIRLKHDRAIAETNVVLLGRGAVQGVACHGETHMRYLDRFQRARDGCWQILDRSTVYDHDLLMALSPAETLALPDGAADDWPVEYRFLAMRLGARGMTVGRDLPTRGSDAEATIRQRCATWLAGAGQPQASA